MQAADVICTTCVGAGDPRLSNVNLRFRQASTYYAAIFCLCQRRWRVCQRNCIAIFPPPRCTYLLCVLPENHVASHFERCCCCVCCRVCSTGVDRRGNSGHGGRMSDPDCHGCQAAGAGGGPLPIGPGECNATAATVLVAKRSKISMRPSGPQDRRDLDDTVWVPPDHLVALACTRVVMVRGYCCDKMQHIGLLRTQAEQAVTARLLCLLFLMSRFVLNCIVC